MRDDPLKNLAVVQAVKNVPQLYERDPKISKQELDRLWDGIGDQMGLSGIAARDRWRIIRGSYVRYLRTKVSAGGCRKDYYLSKYMEFLKPFLKIKTDFEEDGDELEESPITETTTMIKSSARKRPRPEPTKQELIESSAEETEADLTVLPDEELTLDDPSKNSYNFTLCNGRLIPNDPLPAVEESRTTALNSTAVDEETNSDMLFFKSLLQDMATLSKKKKNTFKLTVLSALNDLMDD